MLPDETVARFRDDWNALTDRSAGDIGVAVSGGGDSLALLLLSAAAFPGRVHAATVDHGLRDESPAEAEVVRTICAQLGVAHTIIKLKMESGGNVSARARVRRYAALEEWRKATGVAWIATGHHADDQLETIVMRLNRASGIGGLSGIRRRNGFVVRPVLSWRRTELAAVVADAGLKPADDPTNRDDRYDRARLRKSLAGANWFNAQAVTQSAGLLADADDALNWAASLVELGDAAMAAVPDEIARRAILRALHMIDPTLNPRGEALTRVLATLRAGRKAMIGAITCMPGAVWRFDHAPRRRSFTPPEVS